MILEQIEAIGFRNLQGSSDFSPDLNIFYGDNAQGKTNWLEAIYVLGNTKSFRTKQLRDVVAFEPGIADANSTVGEGWGAEAVGESVGEPVGEIGNGSGAGSGDAGTV